MKLKLPPVVVFIMFFLLMFILSRFLPFGQFNFFGRSPMIYVLVSLAVLITLISVGQFFASKTTVNPRNPMYTSKLITNGVYKFSRNPMYLALLLVLFAWGMWLGNAFNVLVAVGFVWYMNKFQIIPEERALITLFGKEYQKYCEEVRRWF